MNLDKSWSTIGRETSLFKSDLDLFNSDIDALVRTSKFLVIGGAGSIGQAFVKEIFKRSPRLLHVVDISENNMVELVRDLRSSYGYIKGEFKVFPLDCSSTEFNKLLNSGVTYDYVVNLSAMKHVRSEKDPFTLMRLIQVNIFNAIAILESSINAGAKKYFCVSTDKAANPVNMMGASKRIMEMYLMRPENAISISMARFANVAFSDGSLLYGFTQRINKCQPIAAPQDVLRYFITPQEAGELCMLSCLFGSNRENFFPKLDGALKLNSFSDLAIKYLYSIGYEAYPCATENEARERASELISKKQWPCYFFDSDTTGEKNVEEFYTEKENIDFNKFVSIGVIKNIASTNSEELRIFMREIDMMRKSNVDWSKEKLVQLFTSLIPEFRHIELNKYLDQKM